MDNTVRDKKTTTQNAEQLIDAGNAFSPDTDVFLSENGLLFVYDLPGVKKGDVSIEVDEQNVLIVRAESGHKEPSEAAIIQYRMGNYYRAFQISTEYNKDAISADLSDGVLTVTVPKREEAKLRRIEINV